MPVPGNRKRASSTTVVLFWIFGVAAWVTVNGTYVALPLMVSHQPEGWNLPSYITIVIELANVGPIVHAAVVRRTGRLHAAATIRVILLINAAAMVGMAASWQQTWFVGGRLHSVALLCWVFVAALADCTSSVVFWPFVARFHTVYISALSTGEGLSGVVPAILSSIQLARGSEEPPLFGLSVYFLLLSLMVLLSFAAFEILLRRGHEERRLVDEGDRNSLASVSPTPLLQTPVEPASLPHHLQPPRGCLPSCGGPPLLLAICFWLNFLQNGLLPSIISFSCMPYGRAVYHYVQLAQMLTDPLCSSLGLVHHFSLPAILVMVVTVTGINVWFLAVGVSAAHGVLLSPTAASVSLVACGGVCRGLTAVAKMDTNVHLRNSGSTPGSHPVSLEGMGKGHLGNGDGGSARALYRAGVATQLGCFAGSVVGFYVVNMTTLFGSSKN